MENIPFKMKGFSGFGSESPLKSSIPVKKGESYKNYLDRAFKQSKDPYGKDVGNKEWHAKQTKQHAQDAKKIRRGVYKGIKSKISSGLSKVGFSDKTIQSMSRGLTTVKQFAKRIPKVGPAGVAITTATTVYPGVKKVVKATQKKLETEAKERSTKSAQTLFRGPKY
tara:strand:- start:31 stop:531 length:501 start_codon:yes stop_codon:yes gene_type:complete